VGFIDNNNNNNTGNNSNNTYHIKMAALEELRYALKVKRINDELLEHLASTLRWLLRYGEINNITLPEKDKIVLALDRAMKIAGKLPSSQTSATHLSTPKDNTPEDYRTIIIIILLFGWRLLLDQLILRCIASGVYHHPFVIKG
jgi:hypothetical protein